jgi:hypothetical protein
MKGQLPSVIGFSVNIDLYIILTVKFYFLEALEEQGALPPGPELKSISKNTFHVLGLGFHYLTN